MLNEWNKKKKKKRYKLQVVYRLDMHKCNAFNTKKQFLLSHQVESPKIKKKKTVMKRNDKCIRQFTFVRVFFFSPYEMKMHFQVHHTSICCCSSTIRLPLTPNPSRLVGIPTWDTPICNTFTPGNHSASFQCCFSMLMKNIFILKVQSLLSLILMGIRVCSWVNCIKLKCETNLWIMPACSHHRISRIRMTNYAAIEEGRWLSLFMKENMNSRLRFCITCCWHE